MDYSIRSSCPQNLRDAKRDLGLTEYAGQFGQSLVPFGGNIIKTEWLTIIEKQITFKKSLVSITS